MLSSCLRYNNDSAVLDHVLIWEWSFSPICSLFPFVGKIPYKTSTPLWELLKELLLWKGSSCAGWWLPWKLCIEIQLPACWLELQLTSMWEATTPYISLFYPLHLIFPSRPKPVLSCRNVLEDLYCAEWSCAINISWGRYTVRKKIMCWAYFACLVWFSYFTDPF